MKIKKTSKADPLHAEFMKIYFEWMENIIGVKPQIDGGDGKALKLTIQYFRSISQDETAIKEAWKAVFENYNKWDKFHQKQLRLRQIGSNLTNIINSIKNGKTNPTTKSIAEMREEIGNID